MWMDEKVGNEVYSGRTKYWIGEVGLIYPSEYGYAAGGCLSTNLYDYRNSCKNNDWLFTLNVSHTITSDLKSSSYNFRVGSSGFVRYDIPVWVTGSVHPTVYLKNSVKTIGGDGTKANPYQLTT